MKIVNSEYKILVVDDVITNVLLLQVLLKKEGFNVITASNGKLALEAVEKDTPDLILLDINMPGMNGFEVAKDIKKDFRSEDIPIIFLTALDNTANIVKGFQMGGSDYITKPFSKEELMARVIHQLSLLDAKRTIIKQTQELKDIMLARDKMYSVIAHDLRSPMASMKMIMDSLVLGVNKEMMGDNMYELLTFANKTTENIYSLLDNLLKWTKMQIGKLVVIPQNMNLIDTTQGIIEVFANIAEMKKVKIEFNSLAPSAEVYADIDMIKSCIRNLISNAIKFSYENNVIKVSIEESDIDFILSVSDYGCGISEENQNKLLKIDTHYTVYGTAQEEGAGLGLLLTKEFVDIHKGKLWFESKEGIGTTFYFSIPKK